VSLTNPTECSKNSDRRRQIRRVGGITLTERTRGLLHSLIERGREDVLSRGSGANFLSLPAVAAYTSMKPYSHDFTEALCEEFVGSGTTPAPVDSVRTQFSEPARTDDDSASGLPRPLASIEI